jgi:hypothetical protein
MEESITEHPAIKQDRKTQIRTANGTNFNMEESITEHPVIKQDRKTQIRTAKGTNFNIEESITEHPVHKDLSCTGTRQRNQFQC